MIPVSLRQLRYFDALTRHRHFGRAAAACAITQPALSMQIKELEEALGALLIERGARQIRLTKFGEEASLRVRDILRSVEDRLITDGVVPLVATTAVDVALYILNQKRAHLKDIEARYQVPVTVTADKELHVSQFVIERAAEGAHYNGDSPVVQMDWAHHREEVPAPASAPAAETDGEQGKRRSRRRRRGRGRGDDAERPASAAKSAETADEETAVEAGPEETAEADGETQPRKSRRRGRRGGRRGRGRGGQSAGAEQHETQTESGPADAESQPAEASGDETGAPKDERPNGKDHDKDREAKPQAEEDFAHDEVTPPQREREPAFSVAAPREEPVRATDARIESEDGDEPAPRRRGWWSRG